MLTDLPKAMQEYMGTVIWVEMLSKKEKETYFDRWLSCCCYFDGQFMGL